MTRETLRAVETEESKNTKAVYRFGATHSSKEDWETRRSEGVALSRNINSSTAESRRSVFDKPKSFPISKHKVKEAYEKIKANRGAAGIDRQSIEDFEKNLKANLYRIWNRMSSGTYFPPPVKEVSIPKKDGGTRTLGIPTVADRVAQMVVKLELEPLVESEFHPDSYGYRPGKSAHQAIEMARTRCWKKHWVVDLDIKAFFDNLDHELMMKAVQHHVKSKWVLLYIKRWLKAPAVGADSTVKPREKGTPQGGVISPLLANLFLHYAFDHWAKQNLQDMEFERYADDLVLHCRSRSQALCVLQMVTRRLKKCKLELHPRKTQVVFCRSGKNVIRLGHPTEFDFLGFTFRSRSAKTSTGRIFDSFLPAMSRASRKKVFKRIQFWHVGRASDLSLEDLSKMYNPVIRGWVNYYGSFYPQALKPLNTYWHQSLTKWARRKYKRFHNSRTLAGQWINSVERRDPKLFAIWELFEPRQRLDNRSRMS